MQKSEYVTDKTLRAWLRAGATDRGIGGGLTFIASPAAAKRTTATWLLRYRFGGAHKEKVLGRYPDLSLKDAREAARRDRALVQQGVDVAAAKRIARIDAQERHTVKSLGQAWFERYIVKTYKHPEVVERVLRRHIYPMIGQVPVREVRPWHIDKTLTAIVEAGAPTVANDAMRHLLRMFHFASKKLWVQINPVTGFELSDAGGEEKSRERWLALHELVALAKAMRNNDSFGRINELSVWLLLALCVRKMELLSAKWEEFDLTRGIWLLRSARTKTSEPIEIPLTAQVMTWLDEVRVFACGSEYLFPIRRRVRRLQGAARKNRYEHMSPDTLNVALKRLELDHIEHFIVHDLRRTARTHMAALGIGRFVAERALNHKLGDVEGIYDRHDYFDERDVALERWCKLLESIRLGELDHCDAPSDRTVRRSRAAARLHDGSNALYLPDGAEESPSPKLIEMK